MRDNLRKYGVATTIPFELFQLDGVDFRTDAAHVAGDTTRVLDGGGEGPTNNGFVIQGKGYGIVLTATEMEAALVTIYVVDQSPTKQWLDRAIHIETYGHNLAHHRMDLDSVRPGWTDVIQESYANVGAEMTPDQALYMILQTLSEFVIDGENLLVRQRNGQTQAMKFKLNDPRRATARTRTE